MYTQIVDFNMAFCLRSFLRVKKSSFRQSLSCLPALRHIQTGNVNLVELDKDFQAAVAKVKTLKQDPGNDSKLQLYGLFKQVRNSEFQ